MKIISPRLLLLVFCLSSSRATTLDQLKYDPLFSLNHKSKPSQQVVFSDSQLKKALPQQLPQKKEQKDERRLWFWNDDDDEEKEAKSKDQPDATTEEQFNQSFSKVQELLKLAGDLQNDEQFKIEVGIITKPRGSGVLPVKSEAAKKEDRKLVYQRPQPSPQ